MTAAKVENGSNVRRARLGTVVGPHGQSQGRSSMSTDRSRKLEQDLGSFTMITGACASSFFPCVLLFYGKKMDVGKDGGESSMKSTSALFGRAP